MLQNMKGMRQLEDSDLTWMQNQSSIKGKVNYKVIFKNLNLLQNKERPSTQQQNRSFTMNRRNQTRDNNQPQSSSIENDTTNSSSNRLKISKSAYRQFRAAIDPKQMKQKLMASNMENFIHPQSIEEGQNLEHFYRKNQIEYPEYQYQGNGCFATKDAQPSSIAEQPKRTKSTGQYQVGQRNMWMSNAFTSNYSISNTNKQFPNVIQEEDTSKLNHIIGCFKDKVPQYDLRRLYNLRQYLILKLNSHYYIQNSNEIQEMMAKILKQKIVIELLNKYINMGDTLNLERLNVLISKLEKSQIFKSYKADEKYVGKQKNLDKQGQKSISTQLQYLNSIFDLKFKSFHHTFQYFDLSKKGYITSADWLRGLREIGQDCFSNDELLQIYQYLDKDHSDQVTIEHFKDILYFQRNLKSRNNQLGNESGSLQRYFTVNSNQSFNTQSNPIKYQGSSFHKLNQSDLISTEAAWFKTKESGFVDKLKASEAPYGKKGVRSESISNLINYEHNKTFCGNMQARKLKYQDINHNNKIRLYGYSNYRLNKAFDLRSLTNISSKIQNESDMKSRSFVASNSKGTLQSLPKYTTIQ
eukprot:403375117